MPSSPSNRLGLRAPLSSENANGPALSQLLIDQLELKVGMVKIGTFGVIGGFAIDVDSATMAAFAAANFKHLKVIGRAKGDRSQTSQDLSLRFNSDTTTNNYDGAHNTLNESGTNTVGGPGNSGQSIWLGHLEGGIAWTHFEVDIFNYKDTTMEKMVLGRYTTQTGTAPGVFEFGQTGGRWIPFTAITSLRFYDQNPGSAVLHASSEIDLYGII